MNVFEKSPWHHPVFIPKTGNTESQPRAMRTYQVKQWNVMPFFIEEKKIQQPPHNLLCQEKNRKLNHDVKNIKNKVKIENFQRAEMVILK